VVEVGSKGECKGAVEYCEGDDQQGGEGMGAAEGGLVHQMEGASGNLAWWAKEVFGCFAFCTSLDLEIFLAMAGKH
jgi:hypothetical protein